MSKHVKIWQMPILLAVVSTLGLASALFADGWADAMSWVALTIPVVVITWHSLKTAE